MSIVQVQEDFFDDTATLAMGEAFDQACVALHRGGISAAVREIIANRIIWAVKDGERDPNRLCERALVTFGPEDMSAPVISADCNSPIADRASVTSAAWPSSAPSNAAHPRRIEEGANALWRLSE